MKHELNSFTAPQLLSLLTASGIKISTHSDNSGSHYVGVQNNQKITKNELSSNIDTKTQKALDELKQAAINGKISVYGKISSLSEHRKITKRYWDNLNPTIVNEQVCLVDNSGKILWSSLYIDAIHATRLNLKNNKRGRKAGDGAFNDKAQLDYMYSLRSSGAAKSTRDASIKAMQKYPYKGFSNGSSEKAYQKRLQEKYPTHLQQKSVGQKTSDLIR